MIKQLFLRGDCVAVDFVDREVVDVEHDNCDADFLPRKSRIRISNDADEQGALRTLGHEVAHFFLDWGGLKQGLHAAAHDEKSGEALVEGVCDMFGAALVEVIRDNPHLVEAIRLVYRPNGPEE